MKSGFGASGEIKMKELMKELVQKYVRPIPLLMMTLCVFAGYMTALEQEALVQNFIVIILAGVIGGAFFAYGYVEKKYKIFLWALIGICIASATAVVQRENQVLITNLFQEAFWGAFVGLLVEKGPRGVTIGALIMGLLFGGIAFWTFYFTTGSVSIEGVKIENGILATTTMFILGAWKGALYGGVIGVSWSVDRKRKQRAKSETVSN